MANDIDMWNDIKELEKTNPKMAEDLLEIFHEKFIKGNRKKAEKLKERFERKYKISLKYW